MHQPPSLLAQGRNLIGRHRLVAARAGGQNRLDAAPQGLAQAPDLPSLLLAQRHDAWIKRLPAGRADDGLARPGAPDHHPAPLHLADAIAPFLPQANVLVGDAEFVLAASGACWRHHHADRRLRRNHRPGADDRRGAFAQCLRLPAPGRLRAGGIGCPAGRAHGALRLRLALGAVTALAGGEAHTGAEIGRRLLITSPDGIALRHDTAEQFKPGRTTAALTTLRITNATDGAVAQGPALLHRRRIIAHGEQKRGARTGRQRDRRALAMDRGRTGLDAALPGHRAAVGHHLRGRMHQIVDAQRAGIGTLPGVGKRDAMRAQVAVSLLAAAGIALF